MRASIKSLDKNRFTFVISFLVIFIAGLFFQEKFFLNTDVAHLLYSTEKMLNGGKYGIDFFTPNPPGILYFYAPAVWIAKQFNLSMPFVFQKYILFLQLIPFFSCLALIDKAVSKQEVFPKRLFIFWQAAVFWILPLYQLGQRDLLLLNFFLPYLLLACAYIKKQNVAKLLAAAVSFFAAITLLFKPYFIVLLIFIEAYLLIRKKNFASLLRVDFIVLVISSLLISILSMLSNPEYITSVIPFLIKNYYASVGAEFFMHFYNTFFICNLLVIIMFSVLYEYIQKSDLLNMLFLLWIGFLLIYILQKTFFTYHILPAFYISLFFLAVMVYFYRLNCNRISAVNYLLIFLSSLLAFVLFIFFQLTRYYFEGLHLSILAGAIGSLFVFLLAYVYRSKKTVLGSIILAVSVSSASLFAFANELLLYRWGDFYKENTLLPLIKLANQEIHGKSIMIISAESIYAFPLIYYTNIKLAQSFDCLWLFVKLDKIKKNCGSKAVVHYLQEQTHPFSLKNTLIRDLKNFQPDVILLDKKFNDNGFSAKDIFKYILQDPNFLRLWDQYHYNKEWKSETLDGIAFDLEVYKK